MRLMRGEGHRESVPTGDMSTEGVEIVHLKFNDELDEVRKEKERLENQQTRLTHDLRKFSEQHVKFGEFEDVKALQASFDQLFAKQSDLVRQMVENQVEGARGAAKHEYLLQEWRKIEETLSGIQDLFNEIARDADKTPLERGVEQWKALELKIAQANDELDEQKVAWNIAPIVRRADTQDDTEAERVAA